MVKSHIGKTCPYCQFPIKQDSEVVQCPSCKVPHHRECWQDNGGCTTFGCNETTSRLVEGERLDVSFDDILGQQAAAAHKGGTNKLLVGALVTAIVVIAVLGGYIIMGINEQVISPDPKRTDTGGPDQPDYSVFDDLGADYYIDYDNGTIPIGDLPIGTRIIDPSWEWEFRTGSNYTLEAGDETKPVTWIIVAKDHYDGLDPHVTLLSEELIGKHIFDNSTGRSCKFDEYGYNHWGDSGTANATKGLRPWLNSTGIHLGEGFYNEFSEDFKSVVITTTLPNYKFDTSETGNLYSTLDGVFIPSATELGAKTDRFTHQIGEVYSYFKEGIDTDRIAYIGDESLRYWTRSPVRGADPAKVWYINVRIVDICGRISPFSVAIYYVCGSHSHHPVGVRPALNLKSGILVSETKN